MIVLGLTGSIGMGKSTAAAELQALGVAVCSSDAIVHQLLGAGGGAVEAVRALFPEAADGQAINRRALGEIVFADEKKLKTLEKIIHPLVVAEENKFIKQQRDLGAKLAALEIPLLFETGAEARCEAVMVVTAPRALQKRRVLKRPGMTEEKFRRILAAQMPDREKRRRADFIVQTGLGRAYSRRQIKKILSILCAK